MKKTPLALLITLGLLSTPFSAFAATASTLDLVAPISDYKIYVTEHVDELVKQTQLFTDAIKKGDIAAAKKLYAPTRVHYESIEPIAELFSDLDGSIDSRVDDHEKGVDAEDFTGFHRLEYLLWDKKTTDGTAELTDGLLKDVKDLQARIAELMKSGLDTEPGYAVTTVGNGATALELITQVKADLFILDHGLPGLNGLEVYH